MKIKLSFSRSIIFLKRTYPCIVIAATLCFSSASFSTTTAISQEMLPESIFATNDMRSVMTFNLRRASDKAERSWEVRRPQVTQIIKQYRPIFLGTQEGFHQQIEDLKADLPNYRAIGVSRQGNTEDEYSAMFYDSTQADVVTSGNFWLSDTPDKAGTYFDGTGHPRMVSWGKFQVKAVNQPVYFFNTHLALEENVSEKQVALLIQQIEKISEAKSEIFVVGDFNIIRQSSVWKKFIDAGFQDAWQIAKHQSGPNFSFHNWQGTSAVTDDSKEKSAYIIDWILHRGANLNADYPLLVNIDAANINNVYPSDHFPVILTNLGTAKAVTGDISITNNSVLASTPIDIQAKLTNIGGIGVVPGTLYIDRQEAQTKWIVLNDKESVPVKFSTRLYEPGVRDLTVNLAKSQLVDIIPVNAKLSFSHFTAPVYVKENAIIPINATINNAGSYSGNITANYFIDGILVGSSLNYIPSGKSVQIGFTHQFSSAGIYQAGIGNKVADIAVLKDLPSQWMFSKGDNMSWASPSFNDSKWQKVTLPEAWEVHSRYTDDRIYGWYRTSFVVPNEWQGKDIRLILGRIDDADQTFFNGKFIGKTGNFPDDAEGFMSDWKAIRTYTVPAKEINYGKENIIAIRAYDDMGGGGLYGGPLGVIPLN